MTEILAKDSSPAQRILPESVDRLIFVGSVLVIIGLCAPLAAYPTEAKTLLANAVSYTHLTLPTKRIV